MCRKFIVIPLQLHRKKTLIGGYYIYQGAIANSLLHEKKVSVRTKGSKRGWKDGKRRQGGRRSREKRLRRKKLGSRKSKEIRKED